MEIERKWLVTDPDPGALAAPAQEIEQGYLAIEPGGGEARVRRRGESCTLTVKSKGMLARGEYEVPLSAEQFAVLWPATEGRRVRKRRHLWGRVELDVFAGPLAGLIVAEVEFADLEAAEAYEPPPWFGCELTGDPAYQNRALAVDGLP